MLVPCVTNIYLILFPPLSAPPQKRIKKTHLLLYEQSPEYVYYCSLVGIFAFLLELYLCSLDLRCVYGMFQLVVHLF